MTMVSHSIESAARDVAAALVPHRNDVGERVWDHIVRSRPQVMSRAQTPLRLANAACHSTSGALLQVLANSASLEDIVPTTEVILATRALVQNGFSEDEVMSAYRVGTAYWCEIWANAVEEYCPDPQLAVRVASHGTSLALGWLEKVIGEVVADYRDEAARMSREGSVARAAYVRMLLAETDDDLDIATVSKDLRYDVTGRHVAFVLSRHADSRDDTPLEPIARSLAIGITPAAPLIVRVDLDTTLCWVPTDEIRTVRVPRAPVLIGQGRPARGLDGFRRSYRQASEAVRVARLAGRAAATVTRFDDAEIVALCSNDVAFCEAFVQDKLGPLAKNTDEAHGLRATLATYFASNCNFRATAVRLGVHHNTVRYRLERIGALLGRSPEQNRLHLELALHLADNLGLFADAGKAIEGHS
ncbi:helix-turn-helix domain-containing protein [Streptomyces scabiei]|uniref:PucR family transcriptional regulator n=1 Tax=Streptomyces scabiei TaxID=1930 RepID=UPI00298F4BBE|nr:helix-turn-helix domain-containing protein [Streptomyces scabiei]MDW8803279.1 helix-turn-helix domain-containing protein [Streptomyces scabiei]